VRCFVAELEVSACRGQVRIDPEIADAKRSLAGRGPGTVTIARRNAESIPFGRAARRILNRMVERRTSLDKGRRSWRECLSASSSERWSRWRPVGSRAATPWRPGVVAGIGLPTPRGSPVLSLLLARTRPSDAYNFRKTRSTDATVSFGDTIYSVIEEYRMNGAQWVMRDQFEAAIRKLTDTQGRPLWQPVIAAGEPDLLLGYPVTDDRNADLAGTAAGTVALFGDFSAFAIRDAGNIRIERSDDFAFSSDVVTYRAILRTDSDMIDVTGGAIKKLLQPTT